jgi:RimJ/RimL family protein N-acetyltransferase
VTWLPATFHHRDRLDLPTGHHLRPIRGTDVDLDYPAVMGSRHRLWRMYGPAWGWPPSTMTFEQDRKDLERHQREIQRHESFNYAVFDTDESALLGCVYIDPADAGDVDADVSWWVVDEAVATPLEIVLAEAIPRWLEETWPFDRIRYFHGVER